MADTSPDTSLTLPCQPYLTGNKAQKWTADTSDTFPRKLTYTVHVQYLPSRMRVSGERSIRSIKAIENKQLKVSHEVSGKYQETKEVSGKLAAERFITHVYSISRPKAEHVAPPPRFSRRADSPPLRRSKLRQSGVRRADLGDPVY
jgi:hypothetical protein